MSFVDDHDTILKAFYRVLWIITWAAYLESRLISAETTKISQHEKYLLQCFSFCHNTTHTLALTLLKRFLRRWL